MGKHEGERPLPLGRLLTLIGSTPSARIYLASKEVSRCHAAILNLGRSAFVRDLASRTHTRVNGRVIEEADLREGDVLQIGRFTFKFTDPSRASATPCPPPPRPPAAALEVEDLDEPLPIKGRALLIGRRETADISLTESSASSAHALIIAVEGRHVLRDLNSRTGTFVNDVKVDEHALTTGDVVRVGETTFRYVVKGGTTGEATAGEAETADAGAPSPVEPPADSEVATGIPSPAVAEPEARPPDTIPDVPAERQAKEQAEAPLETPATEPPERPACATAASLPGDFDFIPLVDEPEVPAGAGVPSPNLDEPIDGTSPGVLELAESSDGVTAEAAVAAEDDVTKSPAVAAPPAPPTPPGPNPPATAKQESARWSRKAAARAKNQKSTAAPDAPSAKTPRPARPLNPFDVLSRADHLEPLPDPPEE